MARPHSALGSIARVNSQPKRLAARHTTPTDAVITQVGGQSAQSLDLARASARDRNVVIPLVLLVVLAAASILGSLFPQEGLSPQRVDQYFADHPALAPVLERMEPDVGEVRQPGARRDLVVDGRNFLDPAAVHEAGLAYEAVGRPARAGRRAGEPLRT
mgnify:CR=1 FL=1